MATTRSTFIHQYVPGLFGVAVDAYDMFNTEEKRWDKLCHVKTSSKQKEEKAYRSSLGNLILKPEGTAITYDSYIGGPKKTWVHKVFALGERITEEAIDDALYGQMGDRFKDLGTSAAEQPEILVAELWNNATATTYHTCADGLALASAVHTRLDASTYSNTSAAYADLTYTAFWATVILLENQYDHRQKRVRMKLKALVHAPAMNRQAIETLKSTDRPDQTNRAISAIANKYGTSIQDIDWAYQTDTDKWVLVGDNHDLVYFKRWPVRFVKEGDFETGDIRAKVTLRSSVEEGDPRGHFWVIP
jgi:hypothetical protein